MTETQFRKAFLLALVVAATAAVVALLQSFLVTILLAAISSGLVYPLFVGLTRRLRGRETLASALTLVLVFIVVIGPLLGIVSLVVGQAAAITASVRPIVERSLGEPTYLDQQLQRLPGYSYLAPYRSQILTTAGDIVNSVGSFLLNSLKDTTRGTVTFIFQFFILLYTMFFFLVDGPGMLRTVLNHLPLHDDEKALLMERFMSITRATIKGTIIIGVLQGTLSGLAFWAAGIPNAAFWTVVMIALSILPVIGAALVWVPACLILFATGHVGNAVWLALFCALIVGSVDNVLRPRLVGRDTKMHDLVILFSTLGGIVVFGPVGFLLGPILAGLFVTSWELFGIAYRDVLVDGSPRILATDREPADSDDTRRPPALD